MTVNNTSKRVILFEYDKPVLYSELLNYSGGIWQWTITPDIVVVTDDNGNTGYYDDKNSTVFNVSSLTVDGLSYLLVGSLNTLLTTDEAFYYDTGSTKIYIKFTDAEPPLEQKIFLGAKAGFSKNLTIPYFGNIYYEERLDSVFGIKKSKDPLFYGLLKFNSGTAKIINNDGAFDDWRDRNLFRQAARVLIGEDGADYSTYIKVFSGIIGNDSRTWNELSISLEDIRAGLTEPLPVNQVFEADYPTMTDDGFFKPIAYGDILKGKCYCLNETAVSSNHTFLLMDTDYNDVTSIDTVYVDGVEKTVVASDLTAGTFTLSSTSVGSSFGKVYADFTGANIKNGVNIIKDLMSNYANVDYLSASYDTTEVDTAEALSRDTSVYIKTQQKLNKTIEQVCVDIDALFFAKDSGLYTLRIYDIDRDPVKQIYEDDWLDDPDIENNADEFLSSVIIQYNKNQADKTYTEYNNTAYVDEVFDNYKAAQSKTIKTNLTTEADAILKSEVVMDTSKLVQDIIKRTTHFEHRDLDIMDFIICDPVKRFSGMEHLGIYEIIGISKSLDNTPTVQLTLRFIKSYTPQFTEYSVRAVSDGDFRSLSDGSIRTTTEE